MIVLHYEVFEDCSDFLENDGVGLVLGHQVVDQVDLLVQVLDCVVDDFLFKAFKGDFHRIVKSIFYFYGG